MILNNCVRFYLDFNGKKTARNVTKLSHDTCNVYKIYGISEYGCFIYNKNYIWLNKSQQGREATRQWPV